MDFGRASRVGGGQKNNLVLAKVDCGSNRWLLASWLLKTIDPSRGQEQEGILRPDVHVIDVDLCGFLERVGEKGRLSSVYYNAVLVLLERYAMLVCGKSE